MMCKTRSLTAIPPKQVKDAPFKVIRGHLSRSQSKARIRVLLAVNSNRRRRTHRLRDTRDFQFEPFSVTPCDPLEATAGSVALNVCVPSEIDAK